MIHIIPASRRYGRDFGWLKTRWLFSFGDYFDPENLSWGALRVFNDDVIVSGGFPMHGHRDMEIITLVLAGTLEHEDSLGHRHRLGAGEVQVMTAGSGIRHAERNPAENEPVHLLQIWIEPRQTGRTPGWMQRSFAAAIASEKQTVLVCDEQKASSGAGPLGIGQNARISHLNLAAGAALAVPASAWPLAFLYVIAGTGQVNGQPLSAGDQARMADEKTLEIASAEGLKALLLEIPPAANAR